MTQMNAGQAPINRKPVSNVYTVLMFIAFVALSVAVGVTWWKNVEVTKGQQPNNGANPFFVLEKP
ncbi:MAG: hypothetical protein GC162_09690 [Planctomycetes bacterium]|nr:hypothetical protein [Planctomycetota bacterium]